MTTHQARRNAREIAEECVATRARRIGRALDRVYNEALRGHGLTAAQLTLLVGTELMGPTSPSEIGRRLDIERSTLTRSLRLLRDNGWVEIAAAPAGRAKVVEITAAGQEKIVAALPAWRLAQQRAREVLGETSFTHLQSIPRR